MSDTPESFHYDAFISYRHVEPDRGWAKWLHTALETYRVPRELVRKGFPRRLTRVFRDEEELPANADLSSQITTALDQSRFLIIICSPRAPQSRWVNAEIEHFRALGRHDRILALLIEGEPRDAFPSALTEIRRTVVESTPDGGATQREQIEEVEPLAADVRTARTDTKAHVLRGHARLRLIACILGCRFDDLRQREAERRARRARQIGTGLAALVVALGGLSAFAFSQRAEAISQRTEAQRQEGIANQRAKEAEEASNEAIRQNAVTRRINLFLTRDLLGAANPRRAQGREVSVAEVVEAAGASLDNVEDLDPVIEAEIRLTLARVARDISRPEQFLRHLERALALLTQEYGAVSDQVADALELFGGEGLLPYAHRAEAIDAMTRCAAIRERLRGPEHALTLRARGVLAALEASLHRSEELDYASLALLNLVAAVRGDGATAASVKNDLDNLRIRVGQTWASGDHAGALAAIDEFAAPLLDSALRDNIATGVAGYAGRMLGRGEHAGALAAALWAEKTAIALHGPRHPATLFAKMTVAEVMIRTGRAADAIPILRAGLEDGQAVVSQENGYWQRARALLGIALYEVGQHEESERLLAKAVEALGQIRGLSAGYRADVHDVYATTLEGLGRLDDALGHREEAIRISSSAEVRPRSRSAFEVRLGSLLRRLGRDPEAVPYANSAWLRVAGLPLRDPARRTAARFLCESLVAAGDFETAQPLLMASAGLQPDAAPILVSPDEAARIVAFFNARERADPGGGWQERSGAWTAAQRPKY